MVERTSPMSRRAVLKWSASAVALGAAPAAVSEASGQAIAPLYTPKTPIPRDPYKTWSLFLINNPQWVVAESNDKVKKLYDQFEAFGKAIGRDHVAVWFWSQNIWQDSFYYRAVDVIRCAEFCERLKLAPSGGPYILVTAEYPGTGLLNDPSTFLPTALQHFFTVSLNGKSADEVMELLKRLADQIVANRIVALDTTAQDYWSGWQRSFEAIRDFLSNRQMSVTIKTPVSDIQIK